ncbi:hypothetical protein DB346_12545 [Verrucomicrobia bacterium LW23]|nr:hypothetical protein DB346_12545 [Verrucomicrobia bacterium LW23]
MKKRKTKPLVSPETRAVEEILVRLRRCDARGVYPGKGELIKGKGEASRAAALEYLARSGKVVNLGTPGDGAFAEVVGGSAESLIERKALDTLYKIGSTVGSQRFTPVSVAALEEFPGIPQRVKKQLKNVLSKLRDRNEAVTFKVGNANYFLLRETVLKHFGVAAPSREISAAPEPSVAGVAAKIQSAYNRLAAERKSQEVRIADLARECGVPLPEFHAWLEEACRTYKAVPYVGEPTLATPEERRTALILKGEAFYQIRIQGA